MSHFVVGSRIFGLLVLLAGAGAADAGRKVVEFRAKARPDDVVRGWLAEVDDEGLVIERFGARGRRLRFAWSDLVASEAASDFAADGSQVVARA